jgi:hypothetical protein
MNKIFEKCLFCFLHVHGQWKQSNNKYFIYFNFTYLFEKFQIDLQRSEIVLIIETSRSALNYTLCWLLYYWESAWRRISWLWCHFLLSNLNYFLSSSTMGNLRPLKLFSAALLNPLKYHYFIENSIKSVVKVYNLALNMAI